MKNFARKAFCVAALALGGTGTVFGGYGILTNGWSTADQMAGIDLTEAAIVFTAASAGIFYAGYKRIKKSAIHDAKVSKSDGPS